MVWLSNLRRIYGQPTLRTFCTKLTDPLNQEKLDDLANKLGEVITNFKDRAPRPDLFHPQIELKDEILDKTVRGMVKYYLHAMKYQIYMNWQYNGFSIKPIETFKDLDKRTIQIRWHLIGKPGSLLANVTEIPKTLKMTPEQRLDEYEVTEGTTTFSMDEEGKIIHQTVKTLRTGKYRDLVRLAKPKPDAPGNVEPEIKKGQQLAPV